MNPSRGHKSQTLETGQTPAEAQSDCVLQLRMDLPTFYDWLTERIIKVFNFLFESSTLLVVVTTFANC